MLERFWNHPSDKTILDLVREGVLDNPNEGMPSVWDMRTPDGRTVREVCYPDPQVEVEVEKRPSTTRENGQNSAKEHTKTFNEALFDALAPLTGAQMAFDL